MKNRFIPIVMVGLLTGTLVNAQVGIGELNPSPSSQLEVKATNKGVLIPRVSLTGTTDNTTITNGNVNSLLVFNKATTTDVTPGYYYWLVDKWVRIVTSEDTSVTDLTAVVVAENNKVTVAEATTDNVTTYTVGVDETKLNINNLGGKLNTNKITSGNEGQVLVTKNGSSGLEPTWVPASDITAAIIATNGLAKNGNIIELGGTLTKPTAIATNTDNTLAITGLQDVATSNKMVVAEDNGKLRTLERTLVYNVTADQAVQSLTGYSAFVPQIDIYATISEANINITLPTASDAANKGQIITVKVANTTEPVGEYYVNISSVGGNTISGQLPYQSWTFKSNGSVWSLIK